MGLYGAGLNFATLGTSAVWQAPLGAGTRATLGNATILIWVRDTVLAGGTFANGVFGGLTGATNKAAMAINARSGNFYGPQQTDTGTTPTPAATSPLISLTPQSWVPLVAVYFASDPSTGLYVSPESESFGLALSGTLTIDHVTLGDWNLSRVNTFPNSDACKTTTLMAEFAIWRTALTLTDLDALFAGANPLRVRPDALLCYYPLNGNLLDYGPRHYGLKGPRPKFGPHPPVEPLPKRPVAFLKHIANKSARAASMSGSWADAKATTTRSASASSRTASTTAAAITRMIRAASAAASASSIKVAVSRKALGKSSSASTSTAKMAGPKSSKAASADGSGGAASATVGRSASARSNTPSAASAGLLSARAAAGAMSSGSIGNAAVGFIRSGAGAASSGSLAALKLNAVYAVRGASRSVSLAIAAVTQTFAATAKQATGQSVDASPSAAAFVASRVASGAATTSSKASAAAAWALQGGSVSGSITQGTASVRRPAGGASASGVIVSAISTVTRAALGGSSNASTATAQAGGPRASRGTAIGASTAAASVIATRAAAGGTNANSNASVKAGHGFSARGAAISGSAALAKMQRNMVGRSVSGAWSSALALVKRQIGGRSISAATATAFATLSLPQSGEIGPLLAAVNALALRVFLSWRTAAFRIGPDGSVGANASGFVDVGEQGEAVWTLLFDILNAQVSSVSVQAALDYGFAQQAPDGSFLSQAGKGARHDSEAAFSFLQFVARSLLLSQAAGSQFVLTVDPANLASAFAWYSANAQIATLQSVDQRSGSALMTAATALLLGSVVLGDSGLEAIGRTFLAGALALQDKAGWFNERNIYGQQGFDAVYQGVAVHQLAVLCAYFPLETGWLAALQSASTWLKSKIYPAVPSQGWLNVNGSVRSNGQDAPLANGEPPELDIADAGFGLLLSGQLLSDTAATALGTQVLALYDATRSSQDVIIAR